jgi:hypothetical protein
MVTGVEAAGLVLASFPLVISAIQAYREGLTPLRSWWRYRTQVVDLIEAINSQHNIFRNSIELLLDPIITSSFQMNRLLTSPGPGGPDWKDPGLEEKLEQKLSTSYSSYMITVMKMSETLKKLQTHLGIVAGKVTLNHNNIGLIMQRFLG